MSALISLENVSITQGQISLVKNMAAQMNAGEIIGIIGPNGSGKSSLLKALAGLLPYQGTASIKGAALNKLGALERSQLIAYVEQTPSVVWPLSVYEVVALGRIASSKREKDAQEIAEAMTLTDINHLKNRQANTLSGGEFARVMLARALATDAEILLLDEPMSGLDLRYEMEISHCLKAVAAEGKTVVVSIHDLNIAASLCTKALLLNNGVQIGFASIAELFASGKIEEAFNVRLHAFEHEGNQRLYAV